MHKRRRAIKKTKLQSSIKNEVQTLKSPTSSIPMTKSYKVQIIGNKAHVVVSALENPKFKWRTVEGVAKEAGVDTEPAAQI